MRLAEAVAALRGRSLPGLTELTDAALAVLCEGDRVPLALIEEKLVVGEKLGSVPPDVPTVPLQADFEATCRRLRFRPAAGDRLIELDLRKDTDLARSRLLHRLRLLGIGWGEPSGAESSGTFREGWLLRWRPEYVVSLIEQARYGGTVPAAAAAVVAERAGGLSDFPRLTALVEEAMLADLPDAMPSVTQALERRSASTGDIAHLMAATPPLAQGRAVRQRPPDRYRAGRGRARLDPGPDLRGPRGGLRRPGRARGRGHAGGHGSGRRRGRADRFGRPEDGLARRPAGGSGSGRGTAGAGGPVRQAAARQRAAVRRRQAQQRLARALSSGPAAVAWLEGFLRGSGTLLMRDEPLWRLIDDWLTGLGAGRVRSRAAAAAAGLRSVHRT